MFYPASELFIFDKTDCSLVKMILYFLNPNPDLNLCAAVVLQYTITFVANSSRI